MTARLCLDRVTKRFYQATYSLEVLESVTYTFEQGRTYALTGVSGSGKSTLLHILAGLESATSGQVLLNNKPLVRSGSGAAAWLSTHVGLVFQQPYLLNNVSVVENVMLKALIAGTPFMHAREQALSLLEAVELAACLQSYPAQLSGGQQQRVAIARALMGNPLFVLADEPSAHLDISTGMRIIELLRSRAQKQGIGLIMSCHDAYARDQLEVILELSNRTIVQR